MPWRAGSAGRRRAHLSASSARLVSAPILSTPSSHPPSGRLPPCLAPSQQGYPALLRSFLACRGAADSLVRAKGVLTASQPADMTGTHIGIGTTCNRCTCEESERAGMSGVQAWGPRVQVDRGTSVAGSSGASPCPPHGTPRSRHNLPLELLPERDRMSRVSGNEQT